MSASKRLNRRSILGVVAAVAASAWLPGGAGAQSAWPDHTIRIIDPSQSGSSTDSVARMIANKLGPRLGVPVIVENKPGAGTTIGVDAASKAPGDGYTFLLISPAVSTNVASGKKQPFDYMKDLIPVGQVAENSLIVVVAADSPFKTLKDLLDYARANPDGVTYATSGPGSISHIGMELLGATANVQLRHVPYKGTGVAVPDMLSGRVHVALSSIATLQGLVESGKMRALVQTGRQRAPNLPDVPTTTEAGLPGFVIEYWFGLAAPAGTPSPVIARINKELIAIAAEPDTREFLKGLAMVPKSSTTEEFAKVNEFEVARWSKLIKQANVKFE